MKEFERIRKNLKEFGRIFGLFNFLCFGSWILAFARLFWIIAGFWFGGGFIDALFPLRLMIMEQNEAKWRKMKTRRVRGFGKIWENFDDLLKKLTIFVKFRQFRKIYKNAQNA